MSGSRHVARSLALLIAASVSSGCRKRELDSVPAPPPSVAQKPIDRLAPGELAPGDETIFGLVLPRGMRVSAHFDRVAYATGPMPPEDVANYLRDRLDAAHVELGAVGTVFPAARVKGGEPDKTYRIAVHAAGKGTELELRDVTPVPAEPRDPTLSEEERWRRAGLQPNGMPLDVNGMR